jgi:serine/threonine protein kinase
VSDRPQSLQLGGLVGGKYQLLKKIGEGGHGRVYRAINTLLGREVAIKVLKPELIGDETAKKRFFREAKTANLVRHPNVVDVLDVGDSSEGPWMVQELLVGEPLSAVLSREGMLSVRRTVELLLPVLSALAVAHSKGIAHRDFKPENVFLVRGEDGETSPKILDFGLSKSSIRFGSARDSDRITGTGVVVGTPAYLSPERVRMESDGDVRGDVWAIGVVLYECTTGFLPFPARTVREMFIQISSGSATPIEDVFPEVDANFAKIVMRCLRKEPDQRYPYAAEIEEDIRRYLVGESPEVTQRHAAVRLPPDPIPTNEVPPKTAGIERQIHESSSKTRSPSGDTPTGVAAAEPVARNVPRPAMTAVPPNASDAPQRIDEHEPNEQEPSSATRALMALLAVAVLAIVVAIWFSSSSSTSGTRNGATPGADPPGNTQTASAEDAQTAQAAGAEDAQTASESLPTSVDSAVSEGATTEPQPTQSTRVGPLRARDSGSNRTSPTNSAIELRDNR